MAENIIAPLRRDLPPVDEIIKEAILRNQRNTEIPEKVRLMRDEAFKRVYRHIKMLSGEVFAMPVFFENIADQKCRFIETASTKQAINKIIGFCKPIYDGNEIIANSPYHVPAEELLIWSVTSLKAPLAPEAAQRMLKLMAALMPNELYAAFKNDSDALVIAGFKENMKEERKDNAAAS